MPGVNLGDGSATDPPGLIAKASSAADSQALSTWPRRRPRRPNKKRWTPSTGTFDPGASLPCVSAKASSDSSSPATTPAHRPKRRPRDPLRRHRADTSDYNHLPGGANAHMDGHVNSSGTPEASGPARLAILVSGLMSSQPPGQGRRGLFLRARRHSSSAICGVSTNAILSGPAQAGLVPPPEELSVLPGKGGSPCVAAGGYSETSRIVTFLTSAAGARMHAGGVRRKNSPLAGALDTITG